MSALSQIDAHRRSELITVQHYAIELDFAQVRTSATFNSTVLVDFTAAEPGADTFIELQGALIDSIELNGRALPLSCAGGRISLPGVAAHNRLLVRARCSYSRTGEGLHRFTDPEDQEIYLYTQAALNDACRIFACFDQPDLKAKFTMAVIAPTDWTVLSNTRRVARAQSGDTARWQFAPTPIMSCYLVALVAGPYQGVRSEHDGIELGIWCRRSWRPALDTDRMLATTRAGLDYFHQLFDIRYPLDTYDQVFVPEFNFGAMENWGLVLFRDEGYLQRGNTTTEDREQLANTQLHELAHMWFGNLVTMSWWDDLWLNESFAEYLAHRAAQAVTEHQAAWITFLARRKNWGYRADRRSTTHPIAGSAGDTDAAVLNFDGISYAKGASALRQLAEWLGDDAFLHGLRTFINLNSYANATLSHLIEIFSQQSGRDVAAWADAWLRTSGPTELQLSTQVSGGRYQRVAIHQSSTPARPHRFTLAVYDLVAGELQRRASYSVELLAGQSQCLIEELAGTPTAALLLPNAGDETFAIVDLDPESLRTLLGNFDGLREPLVRALGWVMLIQMLDRGRLSPRQFGAHIRAYLDGQDPVPVNSVMLTEAVTAALITTAPQFRQAELAELSGWALARMAASSDPDISLELFRTAIRSAADPTLLRDWLASDQVHAVAVDIDVRWRCINRLAVLGAIGEDQLAAEELRDPSSAGRLHALTARAARPTQAAKHWAWQLAVTGLSQGNISNHELTALGQGFWQSEQNSLLLPYVEEFTRALAQLENQITSQIMQLFVRWFFPRTHLDDTTLALAQSLLSGDLSTAARRALAECRDDLADRMRARQLDLPAVTSPR